MILNRGGERYANDLRRFLVVRIARLSVSDLLNREPGEYVTLFSSDISLLIKAYLAAGISLIPELVTVVLAFGVMIYLSPTLFLTIFCRDPRRNRFWPYGSPTEVNDASKPGRGFKIFFADRQSLSVNN